MNTKNIVISIIIVIVVAVGLYFVFRPSSSASQTAGNSASSTSQTQVQGQDITVGTGAQATPGSIVSVLYVGKLQDGTTFDSSAAHGNQPLTFTLGSQGLITGFQIGVNGMKEGGERALAIPPSLGYGTQDVKDASGKIVIPANSTIIFDVKLVKVTAPSAAKATTTPATGSTTTAKTK